ncbi:aldehyde dehydrogenase [Lentibacter algarum]|uniref:aldehyde dehydrogenase n=1 Tax=Lentibacter algarum TaxID=576131 RepID=UPI001C08DAE5|nr:aldehyde dehydrogenase [Lentibacter algarum]MBU2983707.1 aldehyde dehydrogenase [Lentibacter algarum]
MTTFPFFSVPYAKHFINGQFCDSVSGESFQVIDPTSEEAISTVERGNAADAELAVKAAKDSFMRGDWSRAKPSFRKEVLYRVADLIEKRSDEITYLQAKEMGEPVLDSSGKVAFYVARSAQNFRFFADEQAQAGDHAFNHEDRLMTYTMTDPVGVYALITPWNGPFMLSTWKMAPCLAYGNSAVHKSSELSPLSIQVLCEIFQEAGLPDGVYNSLMGYGAEVGPPLVSHKDVAGVSFTGSPATARDISGRVASQLKRTSFELGGKSACIIFDDADIDLAAKEASLAIYSTTGQSCVAGSRILVQESIYDEFLKKFEAEAKTWTIGDPLESETTLGPVVSEGQYDRVMSYIDIARGEGRVLFGGGRPEGLDKGYFIEPTAIVDAPNSSRICQEEVFGPVAVILPFKDDAEALSMANDSPFGLAGYIWSNSIERAHNAALRLETGMIWINSGFARDLRQPFGGVKDSGQGREGGMFSREFYTETRFASFPLNPRRDD